MRKAYFDYAATTPVDPEVAKAMIPYFTESFGNASSLHSFGQQAKAAIEEARVQLADCIGAKPEEIVFTSGGTESDNTALFGVASALKEKGNHIITTKIEHHAVLEPCKVLAKNGVKVSFVKAGKNGIVDPSDIKKAITNKTVLISVMHANNEIGTLQPIAEIGKLARSKGIYFHTDAVQSVGHIPVDVNQLSVDLLSLSAHKFYGPKGVGALYIRKGTRVNSFLHGGDQEKGKRASTYNTPGIVGLGKAIQLCRNTMADEAKTQIRLRDTLIESLKEKIDDISLNGDPYHRLPNNINMSVRYIEGESMLLSLDMKGIALSTGSACTSSSLEPSHVLLALGLSHEEAHGSLRITLGRWTKEEDIMYLLECLPPIVERLRAMSPLYTKK